MLTPIAQLARSLGTGRWGSRAGTVAPQKREHQTTPAGGRGGCHTRYSWTQHRAGGPSLAEENPSGPICDLAACSSLDEMAPSYRRPSDGEDRRYATGRSHATTPEMGLRRSARLPRHPSPMPPRELRGLAQPYRHGEACAAPRFSGHHFWNHAAASALDRAWRRAFSTATREELLSSNSARVSPSASTTGLIARS